MSRSIKLRESHVYIGVGHISLASLKAITISGSSSNPYCWRAANS